MRDPAKIDRCSIERANGYAAAYRDGTIERAKKMSDDAERTNRLNNAECVVCYRPYGGSSIGGAMCTSRKCAFCDDVIGSSSTNIDCLCVKCAKENGLCKHCGADIDLINRRKPRAYESAQGEG